MSVVQGINTRLQMHTPLQIVRCCNLPLMLAVRVLRHTPGASGSLHLRMYRTLGDDDTGTRTFALFYAGRSDGRHTHRNTHTLSYILSSPLSPLSASSRSCCYALTLSLPSWHRLRLPLKEVIPRRTPLQVTRILLLRRF